MASSSFRSATVEEYDEGPSDNDACGGGALPYAEGNAGVVPLMTPAYQHPPCESAEPPQPCPAQARPVQPVRQYPPEAHHHQPPPHPHGDAELPPPQLPKAPTPPLNPPLKKSKRKTSSSSRRRNKDRPEYYGIRGPSTAVVPAIPPDALPWSSNIRMARRPTTGWYVSGAGSPPGATADPASCPGANSPPRIHGAPANSNTQPRDVPPLNTFRNSGDAQIRGQQPPPPNHENDSHGWESAEAPDHGLGTPHPGGCSPNHPPAQPNRSGPGFIVLNQGHGGSPHDPNGQAHGMENQYDQPPPPPPQAPAQHNPHGAVVLSPNNSRPAGPPNEPPPQRNFYQIPSPNDQRRSPSPPHHPPVPQYDEQAAAHQIPGSQSVHPVHSPLAQPRNGYRRQRDQPSQDTPPSPTPGTCQEFQRLSLKDTPPNVRRTRQVPAHPEPDQFRSHDVPAPPSRSDSASSPYGPSVHIPGHGPHGRQRGGYPVANESVRYTPHPQQRNPHDRQPPAQRRPPADTPAPPTPGDWPESPRQQGNPKTPHPQQPPHGFYPIPEENRHIPPLQGQVDYPLKPSRAVPPQGSYHRRDSYPGPEEGFESDAHEPNTSWSHKHPEDTPTLPEGHPFLRMKDMALATILKEFRAWQSAGMPGRRWPHPRRPPFSCPFAKRDPLRYKDCFSDALTGIADVKEHVSRCHSIPIYCPRCMDLFDHEKARDHHIRYAGCHPQQWSTPDGVTESQKRQLRSGIPTYLPAPDQWSRIYSIVSQQQQQQQQQQQGRAPLPESPYVDDALHEDVSTFREFLETRGPRALSDVLTFRGAATWNLPNEERDLTAFRCLVLEEGVRDLVGQWARRSDSLRSPSSVASSSGGPDQQRTPSMGSFASSEGRAGGYAPASPLEGHHWDPSPRIREEHWDDYGMHPPEQAEFADPRRQKPMYAVPRREAAPY